MKIVCEICDISCRCTYHWRFHLMSKDHQESCKVSINSGSAEMKERTVVAWDFQGQLGEENVIEHFERYGLIHDIYFDRSPNNVVKACVVLLDSKLTAKTVVADLVQGLGICNVRVACRLKSEMSAKDWNRVIGNSKEELFFANHAALQKKLMNESVDGQLRMFLNAVTLGENGVAIRNILLDELSALIRSEPRFRNATLHPFGSFPCGVSSDDGDIDVFVNATGSERSDAEDEGSILNANYELMCRILRKSGRYEWDKTTNEKRFIKTFSNVVPVPAARVPIIRLIHGLTKVEVDLSFNSRLSIQNSKLIKFYMDYDPRVRPLVVLLRYWARFHHLTGSDKIKNYALVLMVIVFLNQKLILPNVEFVQYSCGAEPVTMNGWNGGIATDPKHVRRIVESTEIGAAHREMLKDPSTWTVLELARDWMKMYAEFRFETDMLCPFLGQSLSKSIFKADNPDLPSELPWEKVSGITIHPMCIQDPFVLNLNVTSSVRDLICMKFQMTCRSTFDLLSNMIKHADTFNIMDMFLDIGLPSKHKNLKKLLDQSEMAFSLPAVIKNPYVPKELRKSVEEYSDVVPSLRVDQEANSPLLKTSFGGEKHTVLLIFTADAFRDDYMRIVNQLDSYDELEKKMKVLWAGFIFDFFHVVWLKAFTMNCREQKSRLFTIPSSFSTSFNNGNQSNNNPPTVQDTSATHLSQTYSIQIDELNTPGLQKRKLSDSSLNGSDVALRVFKKERLADSFITDDSVSASVNRNSTSSSDFTEDVDIRRVDRIISDNYQKIAAGLRKSITVVYELEGDFRMFGEREKFAELRYQALGADSPNPSRHRKLTINDNPIIFEEGLSKCIATLNTATHIIKFQCTLAVSTGTSTAYVELQEEVNEKNSPVIDLVANILPTMVPHYTLFRLNKFFSK